VTRPRILLLAIASLVAALTIAPADASFPGDNGRIVFKRGGDIWIMNPDGSGQTQLTEGIAAFEPAVGPEGRRIAFASGGDIWTMNSDGSDLTNVTNSPVGERQPAWSPDGARIAFSRPGQGENVFRIWVMNADGSNPIQLTSTSSGDFDPDWSPDGTRIAFTRIGNSSDIATVGPDQPGSETPYVQSASFTEDHATWSPDGTAIAFVTNRRDGGGNEVYRQTGASGTPTRVTQNPADDRDPSWSPDGTRIAFASNRGGGPQIWTVGAGGVEDSPTLLSGDEATDASPEWAQATPPPPPPERGETVNATAVKGEVLVKLPASAAGHGKVRAAGAGKFVPLSQATQLPIGTTFDTSKGTVKLTSAVNKSGSKTQSANFSEGKFVTKQKKGSALTELKLTGGGFGKCNTKRPKGGALKAARKRSRRLFGSGKGRYRTRGRNSTATVRGTKWLTKDTCAGTLTKVTQGTVTVRDLRKKKTVKVRKGHRYFARAAKK
jgi:Tol biopolymer transport system component